MNTKVAKINDINLDRKYILEAAKIISCGGLVAFPTETVYGLGADALNSEAVKKIFIAKGRPQDNPLIIHVADKDITKYVEEVTPLAKRLIEKYWPGPLTIILKKKDIVPNETSAGLDTIGVRMPENEIAINLIRESKTAIAAPSANISGRPSPTEMSRCVEDLAGKIDFILGGDSSEVGVESTIIDCTVKPAIVLRPGGITLEMLKEVDNEIYIDKAIMSKPNEKIKPKAPGMKYRHYAPKAELKIIKGNKEKTIEKINEIVENNINGEKKIVILTTKENSKKYNGAQTIILGSEKDLTTIAKTLFEALRCCDDKEADLVLCEAFTEEGVGIAIMNRLNKAAGFNIIEV